MYNKKPERKISIMEYGQVVIQNIAKCGGCGKQYRFPIWTSRLRVDRDIIEKLKWANTIEYGLLCPQCTFDLFDECTFED